MRSALVTLLALAAPVALAAQSADTPLRLSDFSLGLSGAVSQPVGAFRDQVGAGGGVSFYGAYHLSPALSLRLEGNFLLYGHERKQVCTAETCRVLYDVDTDNQIASGFFGPQLELPAGPIRPYLGAAAGFSYFFTTSSLSGSMGGTFASTQNYHDAVLALTGGGGVRVPFGIRGVPVSLDVGARYQQNGEVSYLRDGSITDLPDGSIRIEPVRTAANFVLWNVGVTVRIPHPRRVR